MQSITRLFSIQFLLSQQILLLFIALFLTVSFTASAYGASTGQRKISSSRHITVLKPQQTMAKIRANNSKVQVVLFSSFDSICQSCRKANQHFYQLSTKQHKRYDFVFVNTMPWAAKELETSLHYRVNIRHPATMLFYKGKILKRVIGNDYTKMPGYLKEAHKIIGNNQLALYGTSLSGSNFNEVVISDRYRKFLDKYFVSKRTFKALAVGVTGRNKWIGSQKVGYPTQQQASSQALKQCNERWISKGNKGLCKLYMVGNRYVYNQSSTQINQKIAANSQ